MPIIETVHLSVTAGYLLLIAFVAVALAYVRERRRAGALAARLADAGRTDATTGLATPRELDRALAVELERATRPGPRGGGPAGIARGRRRHAGQPARAHRAGRGGRSAPRIARSLRERRGLRDGAGAAPPRAGEGRRGDWRRRAPARRRRGE